MFIGTMWRMKISLLYSIDESLMDVTQTLHLFFPDPSLSRSEKRHKMAEKNQSPCLQSDWTAGNCRDR